MRSIVQKLIKIFPHSLLSEVERIFGPEDTEKFLTVFAGVTLYIPSSKDLAEAQRNLVIYETVNLAKNKMEAARLKVALCTQYDISRAELAKIHQTMKRSLNESHKISASDARVGLLQPNITLSQSPAKRRM